MQSDFVAGRCFVFFFHFSTQYLGAVRAQIALLLISYFFFFFLPLHFPTTIEHTKRAATEKRLRAITLNECTTHPRYVCCERGNFSFFFFSNERGTWVRSTGSCRPRPRDQGRRVGGPEKDRWGAVLRRRFRLYARSPRMRLASWMSLGMMVTRLAWIAHRLVSSKRPTRYASLAS